MVVVRQGVNAQARIKAAAAAVDSRSEVKAFFSPLEMQFRALAHQFHEWASQRPALAQHCEWSVHRGVLHVRRAAPAEGSRGTGDGAASATPRGQAEPGAVPYTYLYEHVERGSDGRLTLVDLIEDHILVRAVQLFTEGSSTTEAGRSTTESADGWERSGGNRRRGRTARNAEASGGGQQQQQQHAETPPPPP